MKGFKVHVVQCIKIDSYALFMVAVCPKDQKKLSVIMKKQVVLKHKHAQLHKITRVLNSIQGICV